MHFMNPVPVMELVELVRGIATDDQTFEIAKDFVAKLGKKIAVAEDFPAFIVNRILLPMINRRSTRSTRRGTVSRDDADITHAHHPLVRSNSPTSSARRAIHHAGALRRLGGLQYRPCPPW